MCNAVTIGEATIFFNIIGVFLFRILLKMMQLEEMRTLK
jgi:hypothetical protein